MVVTRRRSVGNKPIQKTVAPVKSSELSSATLTAIAVDAFNPHDADKVFPAGTEIPTGGIEALRNKLNDAPIYDNKEMYSSDILTRAIKDTDIEFAYRWVFCKQTPSGYDYSNLEAKKDLGYVRVTEQDLKPEFIQSVRLERETPGGKMVAMMCLKSHRDARQEHKRTFSERMLKAQEETITETTIHNGYESKGRFSIQAKSIIDS